MMCHPVSTAVGPVGQLPRPRVSRPRPTRPRVSRPRPTRPRVAAAPDPPAPDRADRAPDLSAPDPPRA